jgi:hypothetical protein
MANFDDGLIYPWVGWHIPPMQSHTRSMIAAAAFAALCGLKVAGLYDHAENRDRRIAAEYRDGGIQGVDGDRGAKFGGNLPEIFDGGDRAYVSLEIEGDSAKGYDRASSTFFSARVVDGLVQVYDYGDGHWYSYDVQNPDAANDYHRSANLA